MRLLAGRNYEIEYKFLVSDDSWRNAIDEPGVEYHQAYLSKTPTSTVRVRMAGGVGVLTIKGKRNGVIRTEYEYEIPPEDADRMISTFCEGREIFKTRYRVPFGGLTWEVDEFHGSNEGLIMAEVELDHVDQQFERPAWVGLDVTNDNRYANSNLAVTPWAEWAV